jgi:DNA-3-methyladenine glycosylase II
MDDDVVSTLREDPTMARLIDRHGRLSVEPVDDEFRRLCVSVLNQQLSTASATAIRERAFDVLDGDVTPERVLEVDPAALRAVSVSRTKTEYLRAIAAAFRERDLTREGLAGRSDEEIVSELTEIYGVGEWTARMYLLAALGREDVLPLGDLAVRKGIETLYNGGEELRRADMRDVAESWRPYRSYGTRYVWAEYES